MKTKGIVMRTSPKLTVIFTEKGDFLEISTPKEQPRIGQTIEVTLKPHRMPSFHNSWLKYSSAAAVLLLVLSITAFYLLFIPNMAVASVALDINKGIELLVNNQGKVIKVRDVNGGSSILEGISIEGLNVYQTVNLIIENAKNKGQLNENQNLVLANVVPVNRWGNNLIDTEILRSTIRDEMTRRNLSGSVVVGQTTQNIQQEAQQQGMTVNSYLIYDRCEEKGIAVQADSLRTNVRKALADANVSVSSLFPEESLEIRAQNRKDNPADTQQEPNVPKIPKHKQPSNMQPKVTENHNYTEHSTNQSKPTAQETSHDSTEPSSDHISPDHRTVESPLPLQPTNPPYNGETDQDQEHDPKLEHSTEKMPQGSGEHTEGDR
ncbi:anti-sigma-I factor RsgI family protein [Desulfosporosinus shakirovi]|uniref:anti-sigma-I factor RsgI family protein n=1 Tax=Desulfosporosinus shakirovi TaxID=2885154 RepID=UPI001E2EF3A0|nr:anti-sigma factor domain-containing protein [Desulfosporosinus sp. SRJS8]MCB8816281.1 anti-sigma factor domain-containing protein [Desulfosporosinus sp. SRJS8]